MAMNSSGQTYTPTDIQSHLYFSFLRGHTADVALYTKGDNWEAVYQLHRVVLIQAGFFRSLFTAGFLESHRHGNYAPSESPPDRVDICFDDVNITRSAFEVCIARLYGGGPALYLSPSLIPTPSCPLTPSFYLMTSPQYPPGNHPATPRFLLSLLATSLYLSISSITSQALSMILSSVGPHTVVRYINFATGSGIGPSEGDDPEAAVGLEDVGKEIPYTDNSLSSRSEYTKHWDCDSSDTTRKFSRLEFGENADKEDGSSVGGTYLETPAFNYGGIGDKIGEACACWLMRWSADILPYEEDTDSQVAVASEPSESLRPAQDHTRRRATTPSERRSLLSKVKVPKLWARGGLSASSACAVISSDDFFIMNEWDRYEFASRVVDLRRRDGLDPAEEKEWAKLFQRGIHYSNMSFEELIRISQHSSPVIGLPYVPIQTIQAAHWQQSIFRQRIVTRSPVSGPGTSSTPQIEKELGITVSTAEILATLSSESNSDVERSRPYYPIPVDSSQRIGDSDSAFATAAASIDELLGREPDLSDRGYSSPKQTNFFGILSPHYTAASCIQRDMTGKARWSPYPPFRFAVQFWGVGQLLEKSRIYSHTVWYAGSLFNVYVQVVRKKGIQLGVYLHRQSSVDAIPRPSTPRVVVSTRGERLLNSTPSPSSPPGTPQAQPQPQTPRRGHLSVGSSSSTSSVAFAVPGSPPSPAHSQLQPSTASPPSSAAPATVAPIQSYRDPRSTISAYFTVSCFSATGSSLTRFSSSPDQFSIGQSWGWKSSSMRTEEYVEPNGEAKPRELNREASLRATVVLGLI